jgi:hypothetical protein
MTRLSLAAYNYENGGLRPPMGYDFRPLQHAFSDVDEPPALVLFCEAKRYRDNGNEGLHAAAEALTDELGVPYVGALGWLTRGPLPPAIFYNPDLLTLRRWWHPGDPGNYDDQRNVAHFAVRGSGPGPDARTEFLAFVQHWDYRSGAIRRQEAERIGRYGKQTLPVIGGGDLNATASGAHLPQRDWMAADYADRSQKGIPNPNHTGTDDEWVPDTAAVDHLIGRWDPTHQHRVEGCGFHAVAELAWHANPRLPLLPTVNDGIDAGGGLLIDWLLVNDAMLPHLIPDTYRVHVPDGPPYPSDHRLVTAAIDL